jgi:hypothetical protein
MKTVSKNLLLLFLLLIACQGWAQDLKILKDAVLMKDGKLMTVTKDGQVIPVEEDTELANGVVVTKGGDYKSATGAKMKLKNGEILTKKGELMILMDAVVKLDGVMMKDGKMMAVKDGNLSALDSGLDLTSGDKVSTDGTVTRKDGSTLMLREGEMINMDGSMMRRKDELMTMDGATMRNGKAMRNDGGKLVPLDKDMVLSNGSKIGMDGTVTMKDGTKISLKDGETMGSKGDIVIAKADLIMDGIYNRDGQMTALEKGKLKTIDSDVTLPNGSTVSKEGYIMTKDGNKLLLRDGDFISMQGDIIVMKVAKLDGKGLEARVSNDHLVFKGGKMMVVKNGEALVMDKEMLMPNGSKVSKLGQVTRKDGSKLVLKENEKLEMNGELLVDKAKLEIDEKNHVIMKNGKMMMVKEGKEFPMTKEVLMPNWSKVLVDGTVEKSDGTKALLKEGERMNMEGDMMSKVNTGFAGAGNASDCITMKSGKMCMVKGGKDVPFVKEMLMPNGSKVMPNGAVLKKDGSIVVMKEGDKGYVRKYDCRKKISASQRV